jgi:hypothetical protein
VGGAALRRGHVSSVMQFQESFHVLSSHLIWSGLSINPNAQPVCDDINDDMKKNGFGITEEVISEKVFVFVSWMESFEP